LGHSVCQMQIAFCEFSNSYVHRSVMCQAFITGPHKLTTMLSISYNLSNTQKRSVC